MSTYRSINSLSDHYLRGKKGSFQFKSQRKRTMNVTMTPMDPVFSDLRINTEQSVPLSKTASQTQTTIKTAQDYPQFRRTINFMRKVSEKSVNQPQKIRNISTPKEHTIMDFYLTKRSSNRKNHFISHSIIDKTQNVIQKKAKDRVSNFGKLFDTEQKRLIIHNIFYRYNHHVKNFHKKIEEAFQNQLNKLFLKYERTNFIFKQINDLISSYKVNQHLLL